MKDIKEVIENLKKYIDTDILEIIKYHENKNSQKRKCGHHSIACLLFCCIDYLSAVVYGKNSTDNAVKFMEEYFSGYGQKALLVYKMWRHGTVHEKDPKILTDGRKYLCWCTVLVSKKGNRSAHLKVYQTEDNPDRYLIVLNLPQLFIDLKDSIEELRGKINSDCEFSDSLRKKYEKLTKIENVNSKNNLKERFDNAINNAVPDKVIDQDGCVKDKQKITHN